MNKRERYLHRLVSQAGLDLVAVKCAGSGHYKAVVQAQDGRQEQAVFANTPGDWRGDKNKLADLKRFARGTSSKVERQS